MYMKKISTLKRLFLILLIVIVIQGNSSAGTVSLNNSGFIYNNIEDAYNAIPGTFTGNQIIEINSGYLSSAELFPITLNQKTNSGINNTITIRPAAGNTNLSINCNINDAAFVISGADYIIIDGRAGGVGSVNSMTVTNTNTGLTQGCFLISNGGNNNIIRYVHCNGFGIGSINGGRTINIGQSTALLGGNNNNTIENCVVNHGRRGIQVFGTTGIIANEGTIIRNNIVKNSSSIGILIGSDTKENIVEGNEIFNDDPTIVGSGSNRAINIQGVGNNYVTRNKIHNLAFGSYQTATTIGDLGIIVIPQPLTMPGSNITNVDISNNFISLKDNVAASLITGIIITNTSNALLPYTANVHHNTCYIGGTSTGSDIVTSCFNIEILEPASVINFKNNIGINKRTGGTGATLHLGLYNETPSVILNADYNCYWAIGSIAYWTFNFGDFRSLPDYQCAADPNEQNTVFKDVNFVNANNGDLHLTGSSVGDYDLLTQAQTGLVTDFDLDVRSTISPYMGADESTPFDFSLSVVRVKVYIEGIPTPDPNPKTITVELWNCDNLGNVIAEYSTESVSKTLSSTGTVWVRCPATVTSPFYISVKYPGAIETWSKNLGESFSTISGKFLNYDFTTSYSKAYCDNLKTCGCKYFIYNGDTNGDGYIDVFDIYNVGMDMNCPALGITPTGNSGAITELNGIPPVDCLDYEMVCQNSAYYANAIVDPIGSGYTEYINRPPGPINSIIYLSSCDHTVYQCTCP